MIVSLGLLQHDLAFDKERGKAKVSGAYFSKLKECIQVLKKFRNEIKNVEAQIEQVQNDPTPDPDTLEYLRGQARRIRESIYKRYEEVMGE